MKEPKADKTIKVSIYCLAFNHEKYIKDTIEGFMKQKTDFDFEVFIHDDASTDHTAQIIQEYAEKYPDIIIPILQKENQYSKGVNIEKEFIFPRMRGQYATLCEGDDYWCDEYKLQKQIDFLDNHPEYSACVHNTQILDMYKNETRLLNSSQTSYDLSIEHVLLDGGADYHTSSVIYRMEYGKVIYSDNCPDFFNKSMEVGDYPLAIYLALKGKIAYFPDIMSVYRLGTPGSWTSRMEDINIKRRTSYALVEMLKSVDEYTNGELHSVIWPMIETRLLQILDKETKISVLKSEDMKNIFKKQKFLRKVKLCVKLLFVNKYRYR